MTLVELILVMVLAAALIAMGMWGWADAQRAALVRSVVEAAHTYDSAIDQYRRDHAGDAPGEIGSATWPAASRDRGPRPVMQHGRAGYVRTPPGGVSQGLVVLGEHGDARRAGLTYRRIGDTRYELTAWVNGEVVCRLGTDVADSQRCL